MNSFGFSLLLENEKNPSGLAKCLPDGVLEFSAVLKGTRHFRGILLTLSYSCRKVFKGVALNVAETSGGRLLPRVPRAPASARARQWACWSRLGARALLGGWGRSAGLPGVRPRAAGGCNQGWRHRWDARSRAASLRPAANEKQPVVTLYQQATGSC